MFQNYSPPSKAAVANSSERPMLVDVDRVGDSGPVGIGTSFP